MSWKSGSQTSWNPLGHTRSVTGLRLLPFLIIRSVINFVLQLQWEIYLWYLIKWVNTLNKPMSRPHKMTRFCLFQSHMCQYTTGVITFYGDNHRASLSVRLQVQHQFYILCTVHRDIFVLFCVLFVLCRSVYCLCVNVYCTAATGWQPNCSLTNISYHIWYHIISYHTRQKDQQDAHCLSLIYFN
jgi:hypothetical protein